MSDPYVQITKDDRIVISAKDCLYGDTLINFRTDSKEIVPSPLPNNEAEYFYEPGISNTWPWGDKVLDNCKSYFDAKLKRQNADVAKMAMQRESQMMPKP